MAHCINEILSDKDKLKKSRVSKKNLWELFVGANFLITKETTSRKFWMQIPQTDPPDVITYEINPLPKDRILYEMEVLQFKGKTENSIAEHIVKHKLRPGYTCSPTLLVEVCQAPEKKIETPLTIHEHIKKVAPECKVEIHTIRMGDSRYKGNIAIEHVYPNKPQGTLLIDPRAICIKKDPSEPRGAFFIRDTRRKTIHAERDPIDCMDIFGKSD